MRLADFISQNTDPILQDWEKFARSIWPRGASVSVEEVRNSAVEILRTIVADMQSPQSDEQREEKSTGQRGSSEIGRDLNESALTHAAARVLSGFNLNVMVAEYRALRASVLRLWQQSEPEVDVNDLDDMTRFNESIDESLSKAIGRFSELVDRNRRMFLAILGHDLRNPLNAIFLEAQAVGASPGGSECRDSARQISATVSSMNKMISDLLDFTSTGLGAKMPLSPAPADLHAICQEVVAEMRASHPTRTMRFQADGNFNGVWDGARLRQVVGNLLGNALEHSGPSDVAELALHDEGDRVRITVRNTGTPIPPEMLVHIFNPLVRAAPDKPRQRKPGSIGLGLYIVREIVTTHGGSVNVTSDPSATVFTVDLPRVCSK